MKHYNNAGYIIDQTINDRGVPVDDKLVRAVLDQIPEIKEALQQQADELTGGEVKLSAPLQIKKWILKTYGLELKDTRKDTLTQAIEESIPEGAKELIGLRLAFAKTSASKFQAFERASMAGRVRGMFNYLGAARTGRWSGRLVQLQNLPAPRPWLPDPEKAIHAALNGNLLSEFGNDAMNAVSMCIRGCIKAPEGKKLVVADLTSIESVVMGYAANSATIHNIFLGGKDTYKTFATEVYGVGYDDVTKEQRSFCKPPVLGCQYMLGQKGLQLYAEGFGVAMSDEESNNLVQTYREWLPEVVDFWWNISRALFSATRGSTAVVEMQGGQRLVCGKYKDFVQVVLPSGRRLHYHHADIRQRETPWGAMKDSFTYMGTNRFKGNRWGRISAHPGGMTENIVQAMARDVLMLWIARVEKKYPGVVVGHVHDEIIALVDEDKAAEVLSFMETSCKDIKWMPDAQISADGYIATRYRKD